MTLPVDSLTPLVLPSDVKARINARWDKGDVGNRVLDMIVEISQAFQGMCHRRFDEYIETRRYTPTHIGVGGDLYGLRSLRLDADLKSYTQITNGDGATIASGNVTLEPLNSAYKSVIRLNPYGIQFWYHAGVTDPHGSISVNGTWGYGGQWIDAGAGTLTTASLAPTATTLTVTDGTKLEVGQVLNLTTAGGAVEYLYVSAIPTVAGGNVTVIRGFNGSAATTHVAGEAVLRWKCLQVARQIVTRLLMVWLEQDSSPLFGQQIIGDMPFPITVDTVPADVLALIRSNSLLKIPRIQAI